MLTSYTYVPREKVFLIVRAFSYRKGPLPCLELRGIDVKLDYHRDKPPTPAEAWKVWEDFRIAELKIANVTWYRHVSKRRKSERRGWCRTGWELFLRIRDAADVVGVSVRDGSELDEEKFFKRQGGDSYVDDNSTGDETDEDRSSTEDEIEDDYGFSDEDVEIGGLDGTPYDDGDEMDEA